jgi:hypothetical protein
MVLLDLQDVYHSAGFLSVYKYYRQVNAMQSATTLAMPKNAQYVLFAALRFARQR